MDDYVSLNAEFRRASEQLNQLSLGLIRTKQSVEESLLNLERFRQSVEDEKRKQQDSYKRVILRLIEILNDVISSKVKVGVEDDFVKYIESRLEDAIHREGIVPLGTKIGEPFNPEQHTVIDCAETNDKADSTVIEVTRMGYILNLHVVKKSEVIIAKRKNG
jgi:molecular chaperone GrpE (heat shock protein)